ncbi:MAG: DUF917 domain-containing protein [Deltaproteobacteria bacterium]|nr:DUF917 domain-containing protein [Deltaproteobacteria bacterium]
MSKPTPLSPQDLDDLLTGSALLGSGGGGPKSVGAQIIASLAAAGKTPLLANPSDMPDDAMTAVTAFAGAPSSATGTFDWSPATKAFQALDAMVKPRQGFGFVLPGEVGAGNSFIPLAVAASLPTPIPALDAAGARRAIPALAEVTYASHHVPISPIAVSDGHKVMSLEVGDAITAGNVLHGVIDGFGDLAGIAMWAMTGAQMKAAAVCGTTSYAIALGKEIRLAKAAGKAPWDAAAAYMRGKVIFHGKVVSVDEEVSNAFDVGQVVIHSGNVDFRIYNQNENLIAWRSDRSAPVVIAPDLCCYMTADGTTFSNADPEMVAGTEVYVIGAPSIPELRVPYIVDQFLASLRTIGYGGPYTPFEG